MWYSIRIFRIAGIDVKIHWSFVLVILFVAQLFQPFTFSSLLMALFVVASVFSYVLLHEFGHSFAARRFGIATTSIVLWPLGGFANLSSQPQHPFHELVVAAAGPLVNLALAGFFYLLESWLWIQLLASDQSGMVMLYGFASSAVFVNMFLALLNLVPAYPLDGGRIARALLTMLAGPRRADAIMLPFSWLAAAGIAWYAWHIGDMTLLFGALLIALAAGTLNSRLAQHINLGFGYLTDRGYVAVQKGDYAAAIAHYDRVIPRNSQNAMYYNNRGFAHFQLKAYQQALADLDQSLRLNPDLVQARYNRAATYATLHDQTQALADYDWLIAQQPHNHQPYLGRGTAWVMWHNYDRALADFERAIQIAPHESLNYVNRGGCYLRMGAEGLLMQQALADFERAATLDPRQAYAHNNRASVLIALEQYDAALVASRKAKHLAPKMIAPYLNQGMLFQLLGEEERALEEYARILEIDSRSGAGYLQRSSIWFARNDSQQAQLNYGKALEYAADEILCESDYWLRVLLRCNRGWLLDFYAFAIARMPDDARVYRARGDVYRVGGDVASALADYERALQCDPQNAEIILLRGTLHMAQHETAAAIADFEHVLNRTDNLYLRRIAGEQLEGIKELRN